MCECHAEEAPDDRGLAFGEVRADDLADHDVRCVHGPRLPDWTRGFPPIGWPLSGTLGRYLSAGAPDGKLLGRLNLRASTSQLGRIITSKKWGSSGANTMRVINDQSGRRTNLDAVVVLK
jgi:hypothetical protein